MSIAPRAAEKMKIALLGAGAWGCALAIALSSKHAVTLWARPGPALDALESTRSSPYLPGYAVPPSVGIERRLEAALAACDLVLVATATSGLRAVADAVAGILPQPRLLWACKGFERDSHQLPHRIVSECMPRAGQVGVLSGPSFAQEVAQGLPSALVLASADVAFAANLAAALNGPRMRVYSSSDVTGVELGGAVKNVIAIAAGISDGLSLGLNARAALITRGVAEMTRLGMALGGQRETFSGLAGLGDLVLTCTGQLSRNRGVGRGLAAGKTLDTVLAELGHVAEGVSSAAAVDALAREHGVDMPITAAVAGVLFKAVPPVVAVESLLARDPRSEDEPVR